MNMPLQSLFDIYPPSFASITTIYQSEELRAVATLLRGDVVDLGCGSAKLAPYLHNNRAVTSYVGVDPSQRMLQEARHLLMNLDDARFSLMQRRIEDCDISGCDWAVCLNALYAVDDPMVALIRMRQMIKANGRILITTPNERLDMEKLLEECQKDLILHPLFTSFRDINRLLAQQFRSQFVSMQQLTSLLESCGFVIEIAHQEFFAGGLNFVVAGLGDGAE